jgi:anionic cell wall polymer biosynthesis LytR-Cps2A-Psr (LCP) family protein
MGITLAVYTLRSNPVEDALSSNRVINVLFVIEDEKKPLSTYILMYYPETRRAAVFNVPGEIGLLITRINRYDRIDRVYEPSRIGSYENEIGKLLGVEINFSIVITKENLVSLVDLLEGVEIFIPSQVLYRDDDNLIMFPSGMTILDGDKAGVYATYSLPYEERDEQILRRQRFFIGLLDRIVKMNDSFRNPAAAKLYYSFFKTSMNRGTFKRLFDEFTYIDTDRLPIQAVTGNLREVSGQMLLIPLYDGNHIKEIVRQRMGTLTRQSENMAQTTLTVEILNGTAVTGFATRTADILRSFGYDIIDVGNADRNNYDKTLIVHRAGEDVLVNEFADLIRCKNIRREIEMLEDFQAEMDTQNYELKADVTLILGRNFNGRYVTD